MAFKIWLVPMQPPDYCTNCGSNVLLMCAKWLVLLRFLYENNVEQIAYR